METHWSSEPEGNLTITLEPVLSSVSFSGRNLMVEDSMVNRMMCSLGFSEKVSIPADNLDGILLLPLHRRLLYLPHICFWSPSEISSFYLQFRFDNERFRQLHNSSRVLEQHIRWSFLDGNILATHGMDDKMGLGQLSTATTEDCCNHICWQEVLHSNNPWYKFIDDLECCF